MTFAELKRRLKVGVSVTLIDTNRPHKYLGLTRKIALAQTNAIKFDNESWLHWDKACRYRFPDDNTFMVDIGGNFNGDAQPFESYLLYRIEV